MTVPRVLLLAPTVPGDSHTGPIYLRDLCRQYPRGKLCCFALCPAHAAELPADLAWIPMAYGHPPRQRGLSGLGYYLKKLSCFVALLYARWVSVPRLVEEAVRFGREQRVELLWAVLETHVNVLLAPRVAHRLGVPLVSTVWDPPYGDWALRADYDPWSRQMLRRDFAAAVRASVRCGVASEPMQEEFRARYGTESVVMIHGLDPRLRRQAPPALDGRRDFVIGFAGNLYALDAWRALLDALAGVDWCIAGRRVRIRFLGARAPLEAPYPVQIEYLGWRSVQETVELMSQVDVAYLPYWFDPWHAEDVRLCFPGKLSTYLAAGRTVLFHGPRGASPARFLERYPAGLCCHSLDGRDILDALRRFATDGAFVAQAAVAARAALDEELDLRVFLRRFAALIGADEDALLPVE